MSTCRGNGVTWFVDDSGEARPTNKCTYFKCIYFRHHVLCKGICVLCVACSGWFREYIALLHHNSPWAVAACADVICGIMGSLTRDRAAGHVDQEVLPALAYGSLEGQVCPLWDHVEALMLVRILLGMVARPSVVQVLFTWLPAGGATCHRATQGRVQRAHHLLTHIHTCYCKHNLMCRKHIVKRHYMHQDEGILGLMLSF